MPDKRKNKATTFGRGNTTKGTLHKKHRKSTSSNIAGFSGEDVCGLVGTIFFLFWNILP
jgi:hypothetical protein